MILIVQILYFAKVLSAEVSTIIQCAHNTQKIFQGINLEKFVAVSNLMDQFPIQLCRGGYDGLMGSLPSKRFGIATEIWGFMDIDSGTQFGARNNLHGY
jgi:hypothetical protein